MRTLPLTCKDPMAWLHDYQANGMPNLEFFTCLTGCATAADPADIAKAVPEELRDEYREYIEDFATFTDESEFTFINGPKIFGLKEIRLINDWYLGHPNKKA